MIKRWCSPCQVRAAYQDSSFCHLCGKPLGRHPVEGLYPDLAWTCGIYVGLLATIIPVWFLSLAQRTPSLMTGIGALHLAAAVVLVMVTRYPLRQTFTVRPSTFLWTMIGLGSLVVLLPINLTYHNWIAQFLPGQTMPLARWFAQNGTGLGMQILCTCVLPAVAEEILFRGIIQERMARLVGQREAILAGGFAFALAHLSLLSVPYLLLVGLVLGWLRYRSDSLIPVVTVHLMHNFIILWLG